MRIKFIYFSLFLTGIFFLSGCKGFEQIEIGDIKSVEFKGFIDNAIALNVIIPVNNPSSMKFKIKEINLKTTVNGEYLGRLICNDLVIILPRSDQDHSLLVKVHISNFLRSAGMIYKLSGSRDINVDLDGYVRVKSMLLSKKLDINESTNINGW